MKFDSTEALIEYLNIIGPERLKMLDITFTPINSSTKIDESCTGISEATEGDVKLLSLSDSPSVTSKFENDLDENVIFVESYESIPLSCSTGKVTFLGRSILTNVCESDDTGPVIYLQISLNEVEHTNVPFKLKKSADSKSDYIMLLNPKKLSSHE
ncbi:hypothetical protein Xoosp13_316 [Xanthomonas phage Xoo-sp13]|nr:hypothetical protein Xoosp13_316 [Xanthomonas phage Xoo-sp13]